MASAAACSTRSSTGPTIWENITNIRRAEMDAARAILGVRQEWLGFVDSGLPEGDPLPPLPDGCFALQDTIAAAGPLVELIRRFRPHVITTYDEDGGYPHPDHIMCHKISVVAFEAAGDPERYPETGEPWQPLKLYYHHTFTRARFIALHEGMLAAGLDSPYGEMLDTWTRRRAATRATGSPPGSSAGATSRSATTRCGRTPPRSTRTASGSGRRWRSSSGCWPTEDYELARSLVDSDDAGGRPVRRRPGDGARPMSRRPTRVR